MTAADGIESKVRGYFLSRKWCWEWSYQNAPCDEKSREGPNTVQRRFRPLFTNTKELEAHIQVNANSSP